MFATPSRRSGTQSAGAAALLDKPAITARNSVVGKLITTQEAAALLGISDVRVRVLAAQRRIVGARRIAGRWFMPANPKIIPPGGLKTKK